MKNKGKAWLSALVSGSFFRKYTAGYFLNAVIAVTIFLISIISSNVVSDRYLQATDDVLTLNSLFVDVERTNQVVYDYYLYLNSASGETYEQVNAKTRQTMKEVMETMGRHYSRDTVDLCYLIDTFLDKTEVLIDDITAFRMVGGDGDRTQIAQAYDETQVLIGYINEYFQTAYSQKLEYTQQVREQMIRIQRIINLLQISMLALTLVLCIVFYHRFIRGVSDSIRQLTSFASGITKNLSLQEHIHIDTGDELEVLADTFNEMMDTIHRQMELVEANSRMRQHLQEVEMENLRISAALQASQLRLLQSRINPHFLFNTLNMIAQTAYMENAEETAQLMEATADLLRYNLGKVSKSVTIADEIENTKNYVFIQRCRYGKRIRFAFQTEEAGQDLETPCMILQPLVENAISHGVGSMIQGGCVTVSMKNQEEGVVLEVWDNGVGIDPETLEKLQRSFEKEENDDNHMGLRNVYLRLRLFFGSSLTFQLESQPGSTTVRMILPRT